MRNREPTSFIEKDFSEWHSSLPIEPVGRVKKKWAKEKNQTDFVNPVSSGPRRSFNPRGEEMHFARDANFRAWPTLFVRTTTARNDRPHSSVFRPPELNFKGTIQANRSLNTATPSD